MYFISEENEAEFRKLILYMAYLRNKVKYSQTCIFSGNLYLFWTVSFLEMQHIRVQHFNRGHVRYNQSLISWPLYKQFTYIYNQTILKYPKSNIWIRLFLLKWRLFVNNNKIHFVGSRFQKYFFVIFARKRYFCEIFEALKKAKIMKNFGNFGIFRKTRKF